MTATSTGASPTSERTTTGRSGRGLLWAGPVYAVLLVIGAAGFPAPPGGDVAPAAAPTWLAAHSDAVIAQSYVRGLGCLAFVVMGIAVAELAGRHFPGATHAALTGGILGGGLLLAGQAVSLGAAQYAGRHTGPTSASATRALALLQDGLLDMSALPAALLLVAAGLVVLRGGAGPRWFGWFSMAGGVLAVLDALSYDGGPLAALGLVGLVYFLLWALLGGFLLSASRNTRAAT